MILKNLAEWESFENSYLVKPGDTFLSGVSIEIHPEKTLQSHIWRCNKAKEFGYPVYAFVFGYNWKLVREKLLGISYTMDVDYRTKEYTMDLCKELEPLVDCLIIIDPDVMDISSIAIDYSFLDTATFDQQKKELLRGCYGMTYLIRACISSLRARRRVFFAMDGPMYFYGLQATEKVIEREPPLVVTDILRNSYGLVESAQNENALQVILSERPDMMEDVVLFHSLAEDYVNGNTSSLEKLKYFSLDIPHTINFSGSPLPENDVLHFVFFRAPWEKGTLVMKDVIYKKWSEK